MVKSSEWCVDCWIEPDVNEERGEREGEGRMKEENSVGSRRGEEGRRLVRRWIGYRGVRRMECWRDDVPQ